MTTRIFHNPRCSKSRATLALLEERGIDAEVVEYLKNPPDLGELEALLEALPGDAREMVRFNEPEFELTGLTRDAPAGDLLGAIAAQPKLLQRPIVIHDGKARIGRPPEAVLEIF